VFKEMRMEENTIIFVEMQDTIEPTEFDEEGDGEYESKDN